MRALLPLSLILAACAAAPSAPTRAEVVARAWNAEGRADWLTAGELWQGLHQAGNGTDTEAARGLARALEAQGDPPGAARVLSGLRSPDGASLVHLAGVELRLGQRAQGEDTLERACTLDGSSLEARRLLAILRIEDGRLAEALPPLRAAVALAPKDADLWAQLAAAALSTGEEDEAREAFLALAGLRDLDLDQAQHLAGLLLDGEDTEHLEESEAWLTRALEQDPSRANAWRLAARLRGRLGDEEGQLAALLATLEADPADLPTLLSLASARAEREEWERVEVLAWHARTLGDPGAIAHLESLLARRPGPVEADSEADSEAGDG